MIVQSAQPDGRSFVIGQLEHSALAGRFASAWGNRDFAPLEPRALMQWVVDHHDGGWDVVDAAVGRDEATGLPWNLVRTPIPEVLRAGARGPELAERHHPLCGLLVSMHVFGLYCGRYGLSDKVFVDLVPAEHKPAVQALLRREEIRQRALRARLAEDAELARFVEEKQLFHNYKLLQLFDTLALYFNCTDEASRGRSQFANVPRRVGEDVTITVERIDARVYRLDPYPFVGSELRLSCEGRWATPQPAQGQLVDWLAGLPLDREQFTLVAP